MADDTARRPLKTRNAMLVKTIARRLSQGSITPNQISLASVGFATAAAVCLVLLPSQADGSAGVLAVLAAVFIQGRLLCNLFDGLVAVEGGKSSPAGELFNDIPDRVADPLILVAVGYAISAAPWATAGGWLAGLLAVLTAYVRTLGASLGVSADFQGPMAKQHRMAVITAACLLTPIESLIWPPYQGYVLLLALLLIIVGCVVTLYRRVMTAYRYLERNSGV